MNPINPHSNWTESLRQNPSFGHLTDDQKEGLIDSIKLLAKILLALPEKNKVVNLPKESVKTAA